MLTSTRTGLAGLVELVRAHRFGALIAVGLLVRAVLIPITHGNDFVVWDESSAATLHGVDIYRHPPAAVSGPFAYFPLFLYLEVPLKWLALHGGLSFTVLGKLPMVVGDVAVTVLIARELRERGCSEAAAGLAAAAFFLNPLVLYNSAWYGRFDTLGCALLLAAYRGLRSGRRPGRTAVYYGLAVAMKTFPAFVIFALVRAARGYRIRLVITTAVLLIGLSGPYLGDPHALLRQIVFWDAGKTPRGLAWSHVLLGPVGPSGAKVLSFVLLGLFALAALWLAAEIEDLTTVIAATLVLFDACSKIVFEQYLLWPLPWLIILAGTASRRLARASLAVGAGFTLIGLLDSESWHPLGRSSNVTAVLVGLIALAYVAVAVRDGRRGAGAGPDDEPGRDVRRPDLLARDPA